MNKFVIPSESVLIQNYEELSEIKKQFVDYLVEKRDYAIHQAILIAQDIPDGIKIRKMEPRLDEILERELNYIDSLFEIKRCIQTYRNLSEEEKILMYISVVHNSYRFDKALKAIKDDEIELTGLFDSMESFGRYIVFEKEELNGMCLEDIYEFFIPDKYKPKSWHCLKHDLIYDLIDYEYIAERYIYGNHGGGGVAPYDRYSDPERPDCWIFVRYN